MTFLHTVNRLNNGQKQDLVPLLVGEKRKCVGWVWKENIAHLQRWGLRLNAESRAIFWQAPADFVARNQLLAEVAAKMLAENYIDGWRNELLAMKETFSTVEPYALIERASAAVLGIKSYGVHLNGLTEKDGVLSMWLAVRSLNKPVEPGKLDQIVAGGIPSGFSALGNLCKESEEEASIPAEWITTSAHSVGFISYHEQLENGVRNDTIFNYDLSLPPDFVPQNGDGEVMEFVCLPITEVLERLIDEPLAFKKNSAVVLIDFFIRRGVITPDHLSYEAICAGLRADFSFSQH